MKQHVDFPFCFQLTIENPLVAVLGEDEFPTLLHFAARFGFKDMMWTLLECLGAVQALHVRNFHGFTPLQLTEIHGHKDVTNILNSFIQVIVSQVLPF